MKRRLTRVIGYLFTAEDSLGERSRNMAVPSQNRKYLPGVSLKAVFWVGMAIAVALFIGRLS